jgi:hypothetical protein
VFLLMGTWPVGVPAPRGGRTHGGREGDRLPEDRGVARGVLKHARATHAHVAVVYALPQVTLSVADDGHGFDPDAARGAEHRGLRNLRRRAEEVGGTFTVQSAPGAGTCATSHGTWTCCVEHIWRKKIRRKVLAIGLTKRGQRSLCLLIGHARMRREGVHRWADNRAVVLPQEDPVAPRPPRRERTEASTPRPPGAISGLRCSAIAAHEFPPFRF